MDLHDVVEDIDHDVVLVRAHDLELGVDRREHAGELEEVGDVGEGIAGDAQDAAVVVVLEEPVFVSGTNGGGA